MVGIVHSVKDSKSQEKLSEKKKKVEIKGWKEGFQKGNESQQGSFAVQTRKALHYGSKQGEIETLNFTLSHERGSEQSEQVSERVSAAEGASEASSPEQANEWAVRANGRTDEQVAQYFSLYS